MPSSADETQRERLDRNFNELLQELRVAQAGVQILFAFLLTVAFTPVFEKSSGFIRGLHLVTVLFAAGAAAMLTAPAAWHRVLFRRGRRVEIVRAANNFALIGLGLLATAMVGTVFLVAEVIVAGWLAVVIAACAAVLFAGLWFAWPSKLRNGDVLEDVAALTEEETVLAQESNAQESNAQESNAQESNAQESNAQESKK